MYMLDNVLSSLNPRQLQAVKHDPSHSLQILAGPGSGKTAVLTARIAYLILHKSYTASSICAVTFTNKAANEMRERLTKLVGKQTTGDIKMGTFHSLCARYLRQHGKLLGIADNFTVCDADESKKLIKEFVKKFKADLDSAELTLTEGMVLDVISKAKAKGKTPAIMLQEIADARKVNKFVQGELPLQLRGIIAEIYDVYEKYLRKSNSLDFDDLLIFGVRLFREHPDTASWCKHMLVDEFQDTNTIQYELMCAIIAKTKCVSIVGDPDQSIYGWRSAEVENLAKMERDFKPVTQIFLEQNYRSTASILAFSLAIVSQDTERINKSLHTSHPPGSKPVLRAFDSEENEASFIAQEIKRTSAYMGGTLKWSDYAILLRFNALSRIIESALQREGIPSRILGGHKFFERLEVKDILAYLQLVDNPHYDPAFIRASNVPPRGIGDKTLKEIAKRAEDVHISQLELAERICDGKVPDTKPSVKKKITSFVKTIRRLRDLAIEGAAPQLLINKLVDQVDYQEHLKRTQPDWDTRWENVQELITFATDVHNTKFGSEDEDDVKSEKDNTTESPQVDNPLRAFLQASTLSVGGDGDNEESKEKVTISTCHSAKGLEWPVVFIPAVENGVFPFSRTESVPEERRLLYVACTRSQGLLYITNSTMRKYAGDKRDKQVSPFVLAIVDKNKDLFTPNPPDFDQTIRGALCTVLNRPPSDEVNILICVEEYQKNNRHYTLPMEPPGVYGHRPELGLREDSIAAGFDRKPTLGQFRRTQQESDGIAQWRPPSDNMSLGFVRVQKEGNASAWNQGSGSCHHEKPPSSRPQIYSHTVTVPDSIGIMPSVMTGGTRAGSLQHPQATSGNRTSSFPKLEHKMNIRDEVSAPTPASRQSTLDFAKHKGKQKATSGTAGSSDMGEELNRARAVTSQPQGSSMKKSGISLDTAPSSAPLSPSKVPPKINSPTKQHSHNPSAMQTKGQHCSIEGQSGLSSVASPMIAGRKRLGMGRVTGSYSNKKFKPMRPA